MKVWWWDEDVSGVCVGRVWDVVDDVVGVR